MSALFSIISKSWLKDKSEGTSKKRLSVHHTQNNLATRVSFRSLRVGLARLGKREHRVDDGPKVSCIDQCAKLDQLLPVGFHHKPGKACLMPLFYISRGTWAHD